MADEISAEPPSMTKSSRDTTDTAKRLAEWLRGLLPPDAEPEVDHVTVPEANGMSSETLLFDASWVSDGTRQRFELVARVAPDIVDVPVFPSYDLESQFRVMQLVGELTDVPVPAARWLELDPAAIGAPFFVMDRVEGRVPPDVMPYPMGSWLFDADPADQRALQDASVAVLAGIHAIDPDTVDASFLEVELPGDTPLRRHVASQRDYYDWVRGDEVIPVVEEAFAWLDANWPDDEGDTVISWGDARVGNIMYDGFVPVAVLDWEMAALGTRGIDVGWMIFIHDFFQDICRVLEMPGMPGFMRSEDVAATYAERSGVAVADLAFYEVYAALRHAIVMARVNARSVHFGDAEAPATPDEAVMHRDLLRLMMAGGHHR
ncbi:MAG TPA: phosphotransferase family protein [Acidimicrobiales bacterium]